jgi:pyruvate dehydrogenase E1 component beta subunit
MTEHRITYREAINEAIREEMSRDDKIFILGEDIAKFGNVFGTTRGLYHEFGEERVRDTPVSETAIISFALGAAMIGLKPIADIQRIDWITVCVDEIVNQVAKMHYLTAGKCEISIVIKTCVEEWGGLGAQHTQSFESWYAHVPGLTVVMPSNPYDAKGLMKASIRDPNPVLFFEPFMLYGSSGSVPDEDYTVPIGKAAVARDGKDVSVVTWGTTLPKVLKAAATLENENIDIEVIDPRTLYPLDLNTILNSVRKTGRLVIAHQAVRYCGVGAEIAAQVQEYAFDYLDAPIQRVATPHVIIPINRRLEQSLFPQEEQVIRAIKATL